MKKDDPRHRLAPEDRDALAMGLHAEVAASLRARGQLDLAGWVLEQIWDFDAAQDAYRDAGRRVDALRMALERGNEHRLDEALAAIESASDDGEVDEALAILRKRRRDMEVARLLALKGDLDPAARAEALLRAGDVVGAAALLAEQGRPHEALEALLSPGPPTTPAGRSLAARLCWDLGDAEGAARYAQSRLRTGDPDPDTAGLLARALGSLGHDLAAQMVIERSGGRPSDESVPGRYRITGLHTGGLVGAAYVGFDRLTLQEVEIHLLLSDHGDTGPVDPTVTTAVERFAAAALAGASVGHPAIRPVIRVEAAAGLLVLPRAEGPPLRRMIHPPGLLATAARARALVAFLLEGLAAAHEHGLVHGALLPSQIVTDALGRPLLPPFGAHHLAGLAATHTGALEELLAITAPELRRGDPPTVAGDLYAVGALLAALLAGRLDVALDELGAGPEAEVARALLVHDPARRMPLHDALEILHAPVADVRSVAAGADLDPFAGRSGTSGTLPRLAEGIEQVVADSWDDELITLLCRESNPWWQSILDRADRTLVLAPWPAGSHVVDEGGEDWRSLVPAPALEVSDPTLRAAIEARLTARSLVVTPSRTIMLALDDLLAR